MTQASFQVQIAELMHESGVGFGTSGARGRIEAMTDRVCYAYTLAFLQHLEVAMGRPRRLALGGDLRPSTPRIMAAVTAAVQDFGCELVYCGSLPSPALALFGMGEGIPSVMVTGSHIPDDRNGIKFNTPKGEILKDDEAGIRAQTVHLPPRRFDANGRLTQAPGLPEPDPGATDAFVRRYLDFFRPGCLAELRVGLYEHSTVARDAFATVLEGLGAQVVRIGRSERFVPVDTEAIRPEDVELARAWVPTHHLDALVSADGDGDRPLIADEWGRWIRGDLLGILCAQFLRADRVVTPVSSNSAVEKCGWFERVRRTRIGSPYVIAGMEAELDSGGQRVVGYEANGGFLTATSVEIDGRRLAALPTRDAILPPIALLCSARTRGVSLSALCADLPARYTASDRLKAFPTRTSQQRIAALCTGESARDRRAIEAQFGPLIGAVAAVDTTDGLRISFASDEIVHLRPSGNAPELRCYTEAGSDERARELNRLCLEILEGWRET
jgi:phosphomannomutase